MIAGTQIACVPDHASGDLKHPDVQFGFVSAEIVISAVTGCPANLGYFAQLATPNLRRIVVSLKLKAYLLTTLWIGSSR
jgi:hypothetical protein